MSQAILPKEKFVEALRAFARLSEQANWALVYYADHGMELNGINYLIAVDARLETDRDVQFEALPLDQLRSLRAKVRASCASFCLTPAAKIRSPARCAAPLPRARSDAAQEPDGGTLVAYAAKHGEDRARR